MSGSCSASEWPLPRCLLAYPHPRLRKGRELWEALRIELYDTFCDSDTSLPKPWLEKLIQGDVRNLMVGIVSAITARFDVSLGIAIPVAALIAKNRVHAYCAHRPTPPIGRPADEILAAFAERQRWVSEENRKRPKRR